MPPGTCYGRLDVALSEPAERFAGQFQGFAGTVWTSPAARCRMVAEAIGPAVVDQRLSELDFGRWEGRPWDDIPRAEFDAWAADISGNAPPGGESGASLVARVLAFLPSLSGGDHLVVTHGGPLKILIPALRGEAIDLAGAAPPIGSVHHVLRGVG